MFTIYSADVTGNPGNCSYPHKHVILDEASLKSAISHDYVCAEYRNSYRNGENFIHNTRRHPDSKIHIYLSPW